MRAITDILAQPIRLTRAYVNLDDVLHAVATGAQSFPKVERPPTPDQIATFEASFPRQIAPIAPGAKFDPESEPHKIGYYRALSHRQYCLILESSGLEAAEQHGEALARVLIPMLEALARKYSDFYSSARWLGTVFRDFLSSMKRRPGGHANHVRRLAEQLLDPRACLVFDRSCILAGKVRWKVIALCRHTIDNEPARATLLKFCNESIAKLPKKKGKEPSLQTFIHALFLDVCDVAYTEDPVTGKFSDKATQAAREYFRSRKFSPKWANEFRKKFSSRDLWLAD